jgi:hypothetical protein
MKDLWAAMRRHTNSQVHVCHWTATVSTVRKSRQLVHGERPEWYVALSSLEQHDLQPCCGSPRTLQSAALTGAGAESSNSDGRAFAGSAK